MPTATVTATTTHELKLKPTTKRKLLTELKAYAELKTQRDAIDHAMKGHKNTVEGLLEETGESSLSIDGFKTTLVAGTRKSLDRKKLIAAGVTQAQLEAGTTETLNTPYVKITIPGAKEREED